MAEEEAHVDLGGRPPIGPEWKVRLPEDARDRVNRVAERYGWTRAEALRQCVVAGLDTFPDEGSA